MRQYIKDNGNLVEDIYEFPWYVGDNSIPTDQGMEIDSFDAIYYKNPSATFISTRGALDSDAEVGDIIWFYKANSNLGDDWLPANGTTFDTTKYPKLYEILGSNTLPNLAGSEPIHLRGAGNNGSLPAPHTTLALKETSESNIGAHSHSIQVEAHKHTVNSSHYHTTSKPNLSSSFVYTGSGHTSGYWGSGSTSYNTETNYVAPAVTIASETPTVTVGNPVQVSGGPTVNVNSKQSAGNIRAVWGVWYIRAK